MDALVNKLKKIYKIVNVAKTFIRFKPISYIKGISWFRKEYQSYSNLEPNSEFVKIDFYPCLEDASSHTPLDPVYFYQDTWLAKKIFKLNPKQHVDVGSSAMTIGLISQFTPITMVDIRPIQLKLDELTFLEGSILELPFEDGSVESISSMCVVEHIGLGRYGDPLDQFGSEKAIDELKRVSKPGGVILISVPVFDSNKVYFNAHRAFTRGYILELFNGFTLLEEKYQYGLQLHETYRQEGGFGTGLFMFQNPINPNQ